MTNKNHFLAALLIEDSLHYAVIVTTPDSMRCWSGLREYSHFTINPETGNISGMEFPKEDVKYWSEILVKSAIEHNSYNAGKPGMACINEPTIPNAIWYRNPMTEQNKLFYLHLVQDRLYDRFVRSVIDCTKRYEDIYVFDGKNYSGGDLRGKGMPRWNDDGLINQLDAQFYTRLAKRYYEQTEILANTQWIEDVMKPAIFRSYSAELAVETVKFISVNKLSEELISAKRFDDEVWPVPNRVVDQWIDWLFEDVRDAVVMI